MERKRWGSRGGGKGLRKVCLIYKFFFLTFSRVLFLRLSRIFKGFPVLLSKLGMFLRFVCKLLGDVYVGFLRRLDDREGLVVLPGL